MREIFDLRLRELAQRVAILEQPYLVKPLMVSRVVAFIIGMYWIWGHNIYLGRNVVWDDKTRLLMLRRIRAHEQYGPWKYTFKLMGWRLLYLGRRLKWYIGQGIGSLQIWRQQGWTRLKDMKLSKLLKSYLMRLRIR